MSKGARTVRELDAAVAALERKEATRARRDRATRQRIEEVDDRMSTMLLGILNSLPPTDSTSGPPPSGTWGSALGRVRAFLSRVLMQPVSFFGRKKSPLASPRN